ncbi:DNA polymerase III subunit gamma/tau [Robertkochia solimangrovi]|uniref:DNA polymerase III subunit gamma/tau n=1 Tax=Robertkochia solimangrovi TaxID=2213046 RepID=UPI00117EB755|nr:DNA polymerase III subunit gamma/tau [Robertkochia solimangrovi]TRZ42892.1 DNA polymerase III subunit gamma/tau [Robertkochia solimangrovi]
MEHFVVSARKYRPKTFRDVVGQQAITNTLLNAIENNHLAQALLFCGPRGVGKTTCARILAKKINEEGNEREDEDFAFNIFELDAASNNSVEDIRNLIDQVRIPPQVGKYKVYIIDEVHMLSSSAFNAFLKTLEEPPKHAIFILATTEKHKIIPTILSRCQIFDFKRITVGDAKEYLKYIAESQGINAEDDALHIIAQKADGAMRDALSIFDRVVSFSGKELTRQAVTENLNVLDYQTYLEVTDLILKNDIPSLLLYFNNVLSIGFDGHHFISDLASHFRDLMVCTNPNTIQLLEVGDDTKAKYLEQSNHTSLPFLLKALEIANECDLKYKSSKNQRLLVELCLMQLASINYDGEKKNDPYFIIPPNYFRESTTERIDSTLAPKKEVRQPAPVAEVAVAETKTTVKAETTAPYTDKPSIQSTPTPSGTPRKPILEMKNAPVSGTSLKSLAEQRKHKEKKDQQKRVYTEENLPSDEFTEAEMQKIWTDYVNMIDKDGKKIMSSNLTTGTPTLKDKHTIYIELPNDTMKKEVERDKNPLMTYMKEKLNNFHIELFIQVNEATEKEYAFTPQEKYEKLCTRNPYLELLRKEFDLDV